MSREIKAGRIAGKLYSISGIEVDSKAILQKCETEKELDYYYAWLCKEE